MLFHPTSKKAFITPTKTGTHTIWHFLESIGWKKLPETHMETVDFIRRYPYLSDYTIYGFFRDPLSRFESAMLQIKRLNGIDYPLHRVLKKHDIAESIEHVSYDTIVDMFPVINEHFSVFFKPQSAWLDHNQVIVLDFDNFDSELQRVTDKISQPVQRYNASDNFGKSIITQKVRDFVYDYYRADYKLGYECFNKTYKFAINTV